MRICCFGREPHKSFKSCWLWIFNFIPCQNSGLRDAYAAVCLCVCVCVCARASLLSLFSRVWLCDPMDCSPPGSSVHGVFQARILEWVAIPYSRESSQPRDQTCIFPALWVDCLPLNHLGSPLCWYSLQVLNNLMKVNFSKAYEEDWK